MKNYIKAQLLVDELQLLSTKLNTSLGNFDYKLNSRLILELRFLLKVFRDVGIEHSCFVVDFSSFDGKSYFGVSSLCVGVNNLNVCWHECKSKFDFVNEFMKRKWGIC